MGGTTLDEAFLRLNERAQFVPPEAVEAARATQESDRRDGRPPRGLLAILRAQGAIDEPREVQILERLSGPDAELPGRDTGAWAEAPVTLLDMSVPALDTPAPPPRPGSGTTALVPQLGQILIQKGLVSADVIAECVRIQDDARRDGRPVPRLGELLVQRGHLRDEQIRGAMGDQNRKILYCPACRAQMNVVVRPEVLEYRCGTCKSLLVDPPADGGLKVADVAVLNILRDVPPEVRAATADPRNTFGKYVIVAQIGSGGIGLVHKAWDTYFGQYVAIKRPRTAANAPRGDVALYAESLIKEARSLITLRHPNIVTVYDVGIIDDQLFLSMEYVEGRSLALHIADAQSQGLASPFAQDPLRYLGYVHAVAQALHYAHTLPTPVVHCDLKPANVLIDANGRPVVVDFGLAQKLRALGGDGGALAGGTPSYMAPEQAAGDPSRIDARTDVYGLGALLYEVLTGEPPFAGPPDSVLKRLASEVPPRPSQRIKSEAGAAPPIPSSIEALCMRCLEKEPADRWPSAGDVAAALDRAMRELRPRSATLTALPPPAGALTGGPHDARTLAARCAYAFLRRRGLDESAASIAAPLYAASALLRGPLLEALKKPPPAGAAAPGDFAVMEKMLPLIHRDPEAAFLQAWAAETVRRALGTLHHDCERGGRREVYAEFRKSVRFDAPASGVSERLERRARRRLREIILALVPSPGEIDELASLLPAGAAACPRCRGTYDPQGVTLMYGGVCPGCVLRVALQPPPPLEEIGPYAIQESLGKDAMGEIFRVRTTDDATDLRLRLLPARGGEPAARAAMRVRHSGVASVIDAGEVEGKTFVVTEFVKGKPLGDAVDARPVTRERAVALVRSIGRAVAAIHDAQLAHGQLDAARVLLDDANEPHIVDFGFAESTPSARIADVSALCAIAQRLGLPDPRARKPCGSVADVMAALENSATSRRQAVPPLPVAPAPRKGTTVRRARPSRAPVALMILVPVFIGAGFAVLHFWPAPAERPPAVKGGGGGAASDARAAALEALSVAFARRDEAAVAAYLKAAPKDVHGHCAAARLAFERLDLAAAEKHARNATAIDSGASPAWRILGFVAMERLDFPAARDALSRGAARYDRWQLATPPSDEADDLIAQGLLAYVQGAPDRGRPSLEAANERRVSAEACRWIGFVAETPAARIRWQTEALKLKPGYVPALVERGIARLDSGAAKDAIDDLTEALKLAPGHGRASLYRGIARAAASELKGADEDLTAAVAAFPAEVRGWLERAKVRRALARFADAAADASKVIELDPSLAEGHFERGWARWKLGQAEDAGRDFDAAVHRDPRLKARVEKIRRE